MNLQEMHDQHTQHRWDDPRYGLATMKWYGWGSPVGLGIFFLCIGGLLCLIHFAGLIG
ncbi:MAG TPA: hypothetical protein VG753_02425 [Candidatus Paceibacterota bacterium]|nr:hypothetical protein [Candidatus Paceibacterota bacterium]